MFSTTVIIVLFFFVLSSTWLGLVDGFNFFCLRFFFNLPRKACRYAIGNPWCGWHSCKIFSTCYYKNIKMNFFSNAKRIKCYCIFAIWKGYFVSCLSVLVLSFSTSYLLVCLKSNTSSSFLDYNSLWKLMFMLIWDTITSFICNSFWQLFFHLKEIHMYILQNQARHIKPEVSLISAARLLKIRCSTSIAWWWGYLQGQR